MKMRLIESGRLDAFTNMSLDESILYHHSRGECPPTLRIYGWRPPAVSIGYFQGMHEEINVQVCQREGIDCIRRITGGGAVFHDKEVTYSLVAKEGTLDIPLGILESYKKICSGIICGLELLGISSSFAPLNDIVASDRKISGNAQTRKYGCILQHGTILLSVDFERMFSILKIPEEKLRDKMIKDVKERVNSVNNLAGRKVTFEELTGALVDGFEKALQADFELGSPTQKEMDYARRLAETKYSRNEWNFRR